MTDSEGADGDENILPTTHFAVLWLGTAAVMTVHTVGVFAGWWPHVSLTYWIALVGLLTMSALSTIDYVRQRRA